MTQRTRSELHQLGIRNVRLILYGVFHTQNTSDSIAAALETRGRAALEEMPTGLRSLPRIDVPLLPFGVVGVDALRQMGTGGSAAATRVEAAAESAEHGETLNQLVEQIAARGKGVVMTMGKRGVGKTTLAVRIATQLAYRRELAAHGKRTPLEPWHADILAADPVGA